MAKNRDVDARGNCSKCGGTHYGGYMCPFTDEQIKEMEMPEVNMEDLKQHVASQAGAQMPRYKCHKEVWALQIATVERRPFGNAGVQHTLTFKESGYAPLDISLDYIEKHNPHQGGYYVVYDDGYKSFSPAKAFEEGYTRLA